MGHRSSSPLELPPALTPSCWTVGGSGSEKRRKANRRTAIRCRLAKQRLSECAVFSAVTTRPDALAGARL